MLEIRNATLKVEEKTLFKELSLLVEDGLMCCITGESGCGKTSLLRAVMGFQKLDEGFVCIDGEMLTPSSAETFRTQMAYLPQELSLPAETVEEMVEMPFQLKTNKDIPHTKDLLMEEWKRLELPPELYDKKTNELSGGERQRVMIAVCGLMGKRIVLADEPTSALDPHAAALVGQYFRLMAARGASVLTVSHDGNFARMADRTIRI